MYIGGALQTVTVNTATSGTVTSDAANDLWIGARSNGGADREFDGLIDETAIWDRALTAGEVAQLYNGGAGIEIGVGVGGVGTLVNRGLINSGLTGGRLCG
jgi:hypothetical protein